MRPAVQGRLPAQRRPARGAPAEPGRHPRHPRLPGGRLRRRQRPGCAPGRRSLLPRARPSGSVGSALRCPCAWRACPLCLPSGAQPPGPRTHHPHRRRPPGAAGGPRRLPGHLDAAGARRRPAPGAGARRSRCCAAAPLRGGVGAAAAAAAAVLWPWRCVAACARQRSSLAPGRPWPHAAAGRRGWRAPVISRPGPRGEVLEGPPGGGGRALQPRPEEGLPVPAGGRQLGCFSRRRASCYGWGCGRHDRDQKKGFQCLQARLGHAGLLQVGTACWEPGSVQAAAGPRRRGALAGHLARLRPHPPTDRPRSRSSCCPRRWSRARWRASCAAARAWPRAASGRCWASASRFMSRSARPSCRPSTSRVRGARPARARPRGQGRLVPRRARLGWAARAGRKACGCTRAPFFLHAGLDFGLAPRMSPPRALPRSPPCLPLSMLSIAARPGL